VTLVAQGILTTRFAKKYNAKTTLEIDIHLGSGKIVKDFDLSP
jgi:hypothetical protein